ncbi:hypothetical protein PHACT_15300 [Pseudohongiella acticola]|jgi:hypothetical protein|uniref:EF-hand domain-containing protein n=1 Tax=Pseudohongiella acticola TaxID=1524254 RepID=A0A1E8CFG4_9GAMM|nr:hypothetical protein [Pseudohongiella acticola]OFE11204.1 hypothetical protein PHACT_15300 [Pseudohongiella acticola]
MKKSLMIASTFLFSLSAFAVADDHPSFSEADMDSNGTLDMRELKAALPALELQETATETVTTADVKQVLPEADFSDEDVVNAEPIGEEQYQQIVDAVDEKMSNNAITSIE